MNEKPILFSGSMVQAILGERKTQTRRVIKPQPYTGCWYEGIVDEYHQFYESRGGNIGHYLCPYGEPGDTDWQSGLPPWDGLYYVRNFSEDRPVWLRRFEGGLLWGWNERDDPEAIEIEGLEASTIKWKRPGDTLWVKEGYQIAGAISGLTIVYGHYLADDAEFNATLKPQEFAKWKARKFPCRATPGRFMYKSLARIKPRVTSVRVERVQEISEEDARAEGAEPLFSHDDIHLPHYRAELDHDPMPYQNYLWHGHIGDGITAKQSDAWEWQYSGYKNARDSFSSLWEKINAKRGFGWEANPFVWVVEFEKVEVGE